uniref:Heterogeneous nuclear ribonucleoprotein Q n=2 Tax=Anthurium amnicola TaxID=1678845 RepID=A0A1D1Z207_9ARAE
MRTPKSGGTKRTPPAKKGAAVTATAATPAESTPESVASAATKTPPKSGAGTKVARGTAKRLASKAAALSPETPAASDSPAPATAPAAVATPDPKTDGKVDETATPSADPKPLPTVKSPKRKSAMKVAAVELMDGRNESSQEPVAPSPSMEVNKLEKPVVAEESKEVEYVFSKGKNQPEKYSDAEEADTTADDPKNEEGESKADPKAKSVIEDTKKVMGVEDEEHAMEEYVEQEGSDEPGAGEIPGEEGEDEEAVKEEEAAAGGLKEEEHAEMLDIIKERKKKKEKEIFVGGLDRDATEEDVKKAFEKIGVVEDVRLHKDFTTNKNKGFAFVKFADKEQASRALSELKNPVIHGKRCGIAPSEDNDTLFLGNICNTWTKEAIKRRLKDYGVEEVENITLVGDTQNEGLSRGFTFLEFSCHEYAMNAYKRLQKPDVVFGHAEWTAKVAFAEPLREPDPEVMAQVKSVFVDGMPPYWDEDRVKEQFKEYGEVEGVVLARNMPTAKRKDFGFVNYMTHEAAVACAETVNNTELGDGRTKMKVRARLANPLPKTQAVKGGMRGGFRIGHPGIGGFSRFGRGFGRGRLPFMRAGFQGGRGFHFRGRGRGGRFSFPRQPFGGRGGRGFFRDTFEGVSDEFSPRLGMNRSRHGAFVGGYRSFPPRREAFAFDGDFGGPFDSGHIADDPYYYSDIGHGIKRPFSMMEHDSRYLEPGSRVRPHYDLADPLSSGARYRDPTGNARDVYSHDYYGSDYGSTGYSSLYGGERSGGGYYY